MRPQQNRRMRGRGNNNRKGPNPLTRSYESNGPDVKIRGTAQQVAEKYTTLARDAQSSGDRVMAENYLQHAEHYNRVIAAAQAQNPVQQQNRPREDDEDEDESEHGAARHEQVASRQDGERQHAVSDESGSGSGPQPVIEGTPAEIALQDEQPTSRRRSRGAKQMNGAEAHEAEAQQAEAAPEVEQPAKRPRRLRKTARAKTGDGEADGAQGDIEGQGETGELAEAAARS